MDCSTTRSEACGALPAQHVSSAVRPPLLGWTPGAWARCKLCLTHSISALRNGSGHGMPLYGARDIAARLMSRIPKSLTCTTAPTTVAVKSCQRTSSSCAALVTGRTTSSLDVRSARLDSLTTTRRRHLRRSRPSRRWQLPESPGMGSSSDWSQGGNPSIGRLLRTGIAVEIAVEPPRFAQRSTLADPVLGPGDYWLCAWNNQCRRPPAFETRRARGGLSPRLAPGSRTRLC